MLLDTEIQRCQQYGLFGCFFLTSFSNTDDSLACGLLAPRVENSAVCAAVCLCTCSPRCQRIEKKEKIVLDVKMRL